MSTYRHSTLAAEAPNAVETITRWRGQTMGGRVPAFMALAQRTGGLFLDMEQEPRSLPDAMHAVGLDFEVRLEKVFAHVAQEGVSEDGTISTQYVPVEIPDRRVATMHYNDGRQPVPINPTLRPSYEVVQNTEALAAGQEIISEGAGRLVALGAYGDPVGSKVYAGFTLDGFTVGGGDPHGLALTITTGHDGYSGLSFRLAPLRFACTNESPLYFGRKHSITPAFTRRHTKNVMNEAAVQAKAALELAEIYREVYVGEAEKALAHKVTENQAITYWRQVFQVPADASDWKPRQATVAQEREDTLVGLLGGDTCDFGRGTAYAAFQAVTEYMDWLAPVRGADDAAQAANRQRRVVEGTLDDMKQRAWDLAVKA
jgi:hypothetical protein